MFFCGTGCRCKWCICPCILGLLFIFLGLAGTVYVVLDKTDDQITFENSTDSSKLEMGWNNSVKAGTYNLDPSSNISINISSAVNAIAQIFVTDCTALPTVTKTLPPNKLNLYNSIVDINAPINYYYPNLRPVYAISGILDYLCYVNREKEDISNNSCVKIFVFDNEAFFKDVEVDQAVDQSDCLMVGPLGHPILSSDSFYLQRPSYYYFMALLPAYHKLNCTASGSLLIYDLSGLTPDACSLNWTNAWCPVNISKNVSGSWNQQYESICVLVRSGNATITEVSVDSLEVISHVQPSGRLTFILLTCSFAITFIIGVGVEALTGYIVWRSKRAQRPSRTDFNHEMLQVLLSDEDDDDDDDD